MSQYVVSARKYRPQRFEEVVGQSHVTNTLQNAVQNNLLAQSFLFTGPRGVGKTTCARILARTINAQDGALDPNEDFAFNIFELDAASNNSVEDIRTLTEQVRIPPQKGKYRVYIIDEVHMLSQAAFNAFLKTLEEPPEHAIFILATTEKHKIIPTILSRCQIFDFKRIQIPEIVVHLESICTSEGITAEKDALHLVAQKADGALRDALSLFDRLVSFSGKQLSLNDVLTNLNILDYDYHFQMTDHLIRKDTKSALLLLDEIYKRGFEGDDFILGWSDHVRQLLVASDPDTHSILEVGEKLRQRYIEQGQLASPNFLLNALTLCSECDVQYKAAKNKRLLVELTLLRIAHAHDLTDMPAAAPKQVEVAPLPEPTIAKEEPITPEPPKEQAPVKEVVVEEQNQPVPEPVVEETPINNESEEEKPVEPQTTVQPKKPAISLADLEAEVEEESAQKQGDKGEDQPTLFIEGAENIDTSLFEKAWKSYVERLESDQRRSLVALMNKTKPEINGNVAIIPVYSKTEKELLDNEREQLVSFFSKAMEVEHVNFNFEIRKAPSYESTGKPFTTAEKFKRLVENHPLLLELKNRFELELKY